MPLGRALPHGQDAWLFLDPAAVDILAKHTVRTCDLTTGAARERAESRLSHGNVAMPGNRLLVSQHVTDQPDRVIRELRAGSELSIVRQAGDLGGGLYVSNATQLWAGRAAKRWEPIKRLPASSKVRLLRLADEELDRQRANRFITASEHEAAKREVARGIEEPDPWFGIAVVRIINQPYNIRFHGERGLMAQAGLPVPVEATPVRVELAGNFVDSDAWSARPSREDLSREAPVDAAFGRYRAAGGLVWEMRVRGAVGGWQELENSFLAAIGYHGRWAGGMGGLQMVVWDASAVRRFGPWRNPRPAPRC